MGVPLREHVRAMNRVTFIIFQLVDQVYHDQLVEDMEAEGFVLKNRKVDGPNKKTTWKFIKAEDAKKDKYPIDPELGW